MGKMNDENCGQRVFLITYVVLATCLAVVNINKCYKLMHMPLTRTKVE